MNNEMELKKILKWAGVIALVALPVVLLMNKRKKQKDQLPAEDELNIFSDELEG